MRKTDSILEIDYDTLRTITLDVWKQAIWEDIEALKDHFGVSYVTAPNSSCAPPTNTAIRLW